MAIQENANWAFFSTTTGDVAESLMFFSRGETLEEAIEFSDKHVLGTPPKEDVECGLETGRVMACEISEWYGEYKPENIPDHEREI